MHSVTSLDHVRIEVLGGGRSVTATGGQWVDFRDKVIRFQAVQEELDRAVAELREVRAERDTFRKAYDHVDSVLNEVKAERDRLRAALEMLAQVRHVSGSAQCAFRSNLRLIDAALAGADVRDLETVEKIAEGTWKP